MDFFESQDAAKRNTGRLIFLFVLAVISLIVITNLFLFLAFGVVDLNAETSMASSINWATVAYVAVGVAAVVGLGSLFRIQSLRGGGARVAEMMNGRLLVSGAGDFYERRALNVVEEMAIASGTPVPPVYLIDEPGINAFAAGYTPSDAVIGLTRGSIEGLTRDELQGVVAHEFSHILHGDMRINIRLIGVLYGIMVIGIVGQYLLRGSMFSRRSKDSGGIVIFGLGLIIIGFVGTFFGNLIKAAVSRQREFLADASAVQFTRNAEGIGGALQRIATHEGRSYLGNPASTEISHALFEEGSASSLAGLYATHPPLDQRISAILPNWDGNFDRPALQQPTAAETARETQAHAQTGRDQMEAILTGAMGVLVSDAVVDQVGNPNTRHVNHADDLLAEIPDALRRAAHEPSSARALIYFLVLDSASEGRAEQMAFLQDSADKGVHAEVRRIDQKVASVAPDQRLPLVTMALPSLRQLSRPQYELFRKNFIALIELDKKISLFEWSLQKIVFRHLDAVFDITKKQRLGNKDIASLAPECSLLCSVVSYASRQQNISVEDAFDKARLELETLNGSAKLELLPADKIDFSELNRAVDKLIQLKPLQKPALLKACAACITADKNVTPLEIELFRAIADTLDCPMPPLMIED